MQWQKIYLYIKKGIFLGVGFSVGVLVSYLFAVSVGSLNTFSSGSTVSSSQVNSNFTTLKTAIESLNTEIQERTPVGTIIAYAANTAPTGFLLCDGSAVSRTTYAALFAVIGTTWGSGDGSTTFNLPDGRAVAAVGAGTSVQYTQNVTRTFASYVNDQFQDFRFNGVHSASQGPIGFFLVHDSNSGIVTSSTLMGFIESGTNGVPRRGNETRGKQFVVNFMIKY